MGGWDSYCCFCSGPFESPRETWRNCVLEDLIDLSDPKRPLDQDTSLSKDELANQIVLITDEDNATWVDSIIVGPYWPSFVSPPCVIQDNGHALIEHGSQSTWYSFNDDPDGVLVIHRTCLSLLCRRLDTTPELLWLCFGDMRSRYRQGRDRWNGLFWDVKYYGIAERTEQFFIYSGISNGHYWAEREDDEDCNWLLSAPTVFPPLLPNQSHTFKVTPSESQSVVACHPALLELDLLSTILDWIVPFKTQADLEDEIIGGQKDDPPSLPGSLRDLLNLMQVNSQWYQLITQHRQDLFFRLAWQFGWMLPTCPEDWKAWNAVNGPFPLLAETVAVGMTADAPATPVNDHDWRAYLLMFVQKENRHIRNRYRLHRMCVQFARGREYEDWGWSIGRLGVAPTTRCPIPHDWEKRVEKKKTTGGDDP